MNKFIFLISSLFISTLVQANDGGIAALKVDQIKMRETAINAHGEEELVRKITKPRFTMTLQGGEAAKLQKILPSESSVFTGMYPQSAAAFKESFKTLGIYSQSAGQGAEAVTGKALTISCSDAVIEEDQVKKTGKTVCTISINSNIDDMGTDAWGDMFPFEPGTCHP